MLAAICVLCGAVGSLALAAPPITPAALKDASPLPQAWGSGVRASRPAVARPARKASRFDQLLPLPPPDRLSRMPVARIEVGEGRVDPVCTVTGSGSAYLYVVKASAPGVVEYLYPEQGAFQAGEALVRLYDLAILQDLRIGESAMARFASSPFVIAPADSTLPPLPPGVDFPQPTADPRALGIRLAGPLPALTKIQPTAGLQPQQEKKQTGLARAPGLASAQASRPSQLPSLAPTDNTPLPDVSSLSSQLADAHQRASQLGELIARLDERLSAARSRLEQSRVDEAASQRLYDQGILARKVYEGAKAKSEAAESDLRELQAKRAEAVEAREAALARTRSTQQRIDAAMAERSRRASEENRRDDALRQLSAAEAPPAINGSSRRMGQPASQRQASPKAAVSRSETFPSPTRARRPELSSVPRVPASSRLRPSVEVPGVPEEVKRLAAPRWRDEAAVSDGVVVRQLVPEGSQVKAGTPVLEVANREWARVYADVPRDAVGNFPKGAPVRMTFDEYPGVVLEGWVNGVSPVPHRELAQVEMVVLCRQGYYASDTYASLQWMTLAAPVVERDVREPLRPGVHVEPTAETPRGEIYTLFPLVPPQVGPGQEPVVEIKDREYVGVVRLGEMDLINARKLKQQPAQAKRIAALKKWRDSFIAGMTTTLFGDLALTYPREGEIARAVERMAIGDVSHDYNRCARTMREALGWGLGDAAVWLKKLPERGYLPRKDGLARPGDILVWPFTYGPRRSQHIGIAVNQGGRLMLLSNLAGTLGTTELLGGYVAFYHPSSSPGQTAKR